MLPVTHDVFVEKVRKIIVNFIKITEINEFKLLLKQIIASFVFERQLSNIYRFLVTTVCFGCARLRND